jgi:hypothetical protein
MEAAVASVRDNSLGVTAAAKLHHVQQNRLSRLLKAKGFAMACRNGSIRWVKVEKTAAADA